MPLSCNAVSNGCKTRKLEMQEHEVLIRMTYIGINLLKGCRIGQETQRPLVNLFLRQLVHGQRRIIANHGRARVCYCSRHAELKMDQTLKTRLAGFHGHFSKRYCRDVLNASEQG